MLLPDLARLDLHREAAAEAAASTGAPDEPDLTAHEPPLPQSLQTATPHEEVDDKDRDRLYRELLVLKASHARFNENLRVIEKRFPFDNVSAVEGHFLKLMFTDVIVCDEPPNRHLFSSLGPPVPINHMRLNKDSMLVLGMNTIQTNAFVALRALRERFGNKPTSYKYSHGCGTSNCYESGVELHGPHGWQLALRAILVALDSKLNRFQGGNALPRTVAIRAPKAARRDSRRFNDDFTKENRDELGLTLRAAQLGIAPPIFATFPTKILSEKNVLVERGYGFVFEDGWVDMYQLIYGLKFVHKSDRARFQAQRNIETRIIALLHTVADNDLLMFDVKLTNMVGRRVGNTLEYEVRMIDFGPLLTAESNMHTDTKQTSADCVFFVNGLLLLNSISNWYVSQMPMFGRLAEEVVATWRAMNHEGASFCATLKADAQRVEVSNMPHMENLLRGSKAKFTSLLRFGFYRMLERYGRKNELLTNADKATNSGTGFIGRFVDLLEVEFKKVVS